MSRPRIPIGAHLVSGRGVYSHHGIYVGRGRVIHYSGFAEDLAGGPIEEASLESFCAGRSYRVKAHESAVFKGQEVVVRARSRLGESGYALFSNNCEHFCEWCINNSHLSRQVNKVAMAAAPTWTAVAGIGARGVVASTGAAAGLSGAGVMSGLATAGSVVGGGAVAGIGVLGAAPALVTAAAINNTVLKDYPHLAKSERKSRAIGRKATYVGAAAGTAGSIGAISAAGSVAGLGATGITTGLAAIGGTVGGGMAAGVVLTTAAPVAVAAAVGYGAYKLVKWAKED